MGEVVAIGAEPLIRGFGLASVRLFPAGTEDDIRSAWNGLPAGAELVILTAAAERALGDAITAGPLVAVLP